MKQHSLDRVPVILDTDIGSDIDDAVALAYLLRQPRCELLGITTVSGESNKRASLADSICRKAEQANIPIHVGIANPLLIPQKQPSAPHTEVLDRWPHRSYHEDNTAIEFLRDSIRSRPGEITLLAVGPLTNVAVLFAAYPDIPSQLKELVIMGGQFFSQTSGDGAEWNILCDPHAAAIVFASELPALRAYGLDVTTQCQLPPDDCRRRFELAGGPLEPVAAMAEVWFRHRPTVVFHDPLAAACIFEPELCEMIGGKIEVELCDPGSRGQTRLQQGPQAHHVARSVNPNAFFEHYFAIVSK